MPELSFTLEYVVRLRQGDRDARDHFVCHFQPVVRAWLRRRVRSIHLRQDIAQDTFARIFAFLHEGGRIEHPERLASFVTGVARNILRERFRKDSPLGGLEPGEMVILDSRPQPEDILLRRERAARVHEVLSILPERDREILRKLFFDGVHRDEICAEMGVDRGYLRVLVHRASNNFRILMKRFDTVHHYTSRAVLTDRSSGQTSV